MQQIKDPEEEEPAESHRHPAVQRGGHVRAEAGDGRRFRHALAARPSTVRRVLDVEAPGGWNAGLPECWGRPAVNLAGRRPGEC